jgi:hypothetical protein
VRLWDVDLAIVRLQAERIELVAALRPGASTSRTARTTSMAATSASPVTDRMPGLPGAQREWTPKRVQNTLLGLGGLLLTVAGIVFAAVTYDRLGAGGRATVLLALTVLAGLAAPRFKARGLGATAETLAAVTLALAALDAYGLRTLGLAESAQALTYTAGSCLALAVACGLYAAVVPVRLPRFAGVVLAQLPVPLLMASHHATAGVGGLSLSLLAAVDAAAVALLMRRPATEWLRDAWSAAAVCAGAAAMCALPAALAGAFAPDGRGAGVTGLLVLAAAAAGCGVLLAGPARLVAHALPAPCSSRSSPRRSASSRCSSRRSCPTTGGKDPCSAPSSPPGWRSPRRRRRSRRPWCCR